MGRRARHMNAKDAGATMVLDSRFLKLNDNDLVDAWPGRGTNAGATATTTLRPVYRTNQDSSIPAVQFTTNQTQRMLIDSAANGVFQNTTSGAIIGIVKDFGTSTDAQRRVVTFNTTTNGTVRLGIGSRFTTVGTSTFGRRLDADSAAVSTPMAPSVTVPHIETGLALWGANQLIPRHNGVAGGTVAFSSGAGSTSNTASNTNTIGGVTTAISRFWGVMYVLIAISPIRIPMLKRIEQSMGFAFKIKSQ